MFSKTNSTHTHSELKKIITLKTLTRLYHSNMRVFLDLVDHCNNPSSPVSDRVKDMWHQMQLTDKEGNIDETTRDIILLFAANTFESTKFISKL